MAAGQVHVTVDTGISLSSQWLRGDSRCIEAMSLDGQWQDITDRCPSRSIPTELVKEWSARNERTLVTFRITP